MKQFKPYDYQKYCINRIIQSDAVGLFADMGLGKTVITLTAVNDLRYNRFQVKKCLVIAPKKVAEDTWTREQGTWEHLRLLRIMPVLGSVTKRVRALNSPADIYVINRENVPWIVDYYRNDWPFDMVVIDELSSFKSNRALRFKKLKLVRSHIKKIVGLTGTPAPNGLMDLWSQVYLLDEGARLGKTITEYRNQYFTPGSRNATTVFSYDPRPDAEQAIHGQIGDICVSLSSRDYLELPERIDDIRHVKLDSKAEKSYREFERTRILEVGDRVLDAGSAAILSGRLLQIANGAIYDEEHNVLEVHGNKIEAFRELVEANAGQHLLVFYNFKHDLMRIRQALAKSGLTVGELKDSNSITSWNKGETDILLAHPASAAYGLNLQQGGNHVVWFGLNWSLELYMQANARLHRQGQAHTVFVHHLVVEGSIDEDVMKALTKKEEGQAYLLDALKARVDKYRSG